MLDLKKRYLNSFKNKYDKMSYVAKASFWFVIVSILDKGIALITQPIINRILSVDEVGNYGVYNSWYSIFLIIASFNLFGGILEVSLTNNEDKKSEFVPSMLCLSLTICAVFATVLLTFANQFSIILCLKKTYLVLMILEIFSTTIIQFWLVTKRFEYRYK